MKQILPVLFLFVFFCVFPKTIFAAITFIIDNPVREGDYFIVDATISGISSGSAYVQGMFTHTSNPNYFGFTWGQKEEWVSYQSSTTKDFISQNFPILLRDTLQKIWIKPDLSNSGFKGSGDYFLKLRRYTGSGDSSAGESNVLTVYLIEPTPISTATPDPTASPTSTTTPTTSATPDPTLTLNPTRTPTPTPLKTPTPTSIKTPTPSSYINKSPTIVIPDLIGNPSDVQNGLSSSPSSVLGDSTTSAGTVIPGLTRNPSPESSTIVPTSNSVVLKYTFVFGAIITAVSGGLLYFRHKKD